MASAASAPVNFEKSYEQLNSRQALDYECLVAEFNEWMLADGQEGKHGNRVPLSESYAENLLKRLDQLFRFLWTRFDGYTSEVTHDDADTIVNLLREDEFTREDGDTYDSSSKRKFANTLEKYFQWQAIEYGQEEWEPEVQFKDGESSYPDTFTPEEWMDLREATLEYGNIPTYHNLSTEERERWKAELAQRLEKPKEEVTRSDWEQVNTSWVVPSLIWTAQDAGWRPCEIARIKTSWLRLDKMTIHVPKEHAAKNDSEWEVALTRRTVKALRRWLKERETMEKYDGRDEVWLNREGNPHSSRTLNHLLQNLLDEADIDTTNRKIVWYSIRHTLGTKIAENGTLADAKEQLRHKTLDATLRYLHPSTEARRDILDTI